jgi:hypothetical protein
MRLRHDGQALLGSQQPPAWLPSCATWPVWNAGAVRLARRHRRAAGRHGVCEGDKLSYNIQSGQQGKLSAGNLRQA